MTIDDYEEIARRDLDFSDITKIDIYCVLLGSKVAKWARYKYDEEQILDKYKMLLSKIYKDSFHDLKYLNQYDGEVCNFKIDNKEFEMYLKESKMYRAGIKSVKEQEEKLSFINTVMTTLSNQSYLLNTALKARMYASGDIDA